MSAHDITPPPITSGSAQVRNLARAIQAAMEKEVDNVIKEEAEAAADRVNRRVRAMAEEMKFRVESATCPWDHAEQLIMQIILPDGKGGRQ